MKRSNKNVKHKENDSSVGLVGILVIILVIFSILFLVFGGNTNNNPNSTVSASSDSREEITPEEYEDLTLDTVDAALSEANDQLAAMNIGDIYTVNGNDVDFIGRLFIDHRMGDIIYWELSDPDTDVYICGYCCEIIYYDHTGWYDGSLTEQQIEVQAEQIAEQFETLPDNSEDPEIDFEEHLTSIGFDQENNETFTETYSYWYIEYKRSKDNIISEDHIRLMLNPNGDLHYYCKIWNMDLDEFDTTYSVTEEEAEETALNHAGSESVVHDSFKMIVRPNYFWTSEEGISFGTDPECVWEVWVKDIDLDLNIYHIHGVDNTIIGGDSAPFYYDTS